MILPVIKHTMRFPIILTLSACLMLPATAAKRPVAANPDLTKNEALPEGRLHDYNLGATGARGWMYSNKLETSQARQILVTKVDPASPADGVLQSGDVILGVAGKPFSYDPRTEFGKALTIAESADGKLAVTVWRNGETKEAVIPLAVLGSYSATAPYDCAKSKLILEQGCATLAKRMEDPAYARSQNPITRSLNALALLASGHETYLPLVRREAEWASGYSDNGFQTWWYAYVIMLLAEYEEVTGDHSFADGMKRLVMEAANGQSAVGSWGHKFAAPDGRLHGYGMMNAPGVPLTISMLMARDNGLKDPVLDRAIDRSTKLLRFYIGKGAVPYGDHAPWTQTHEDNGKCGMAGVMFNFLGDKQGAEFFSRMSVASHGPERDCGHTGNFTNMTWAMPGVALSGPHATGAWMGEFGAWYFDLARTWQGQFPHPGPPELLGDKYRGWDATGAYLLAYAMPLQKIRLTGKQPNLAPQIDADTARSLINDGRGWSNLRRNEYDSLSPDELIEMLASWSPAVRGRAAAAIARLKGDKPVEALITMLDEENLYARYGACEALISLKEGAAPAVPKLVSLLDHPDLWLRIKAAETLCHAGSAGFEALPRLLEKCALQPTAQDPRGMEQRYLCFSVFEVMLKSSVDGVDRDLLYKAVAAGLGNEDGRARSAISGIYKKLSPSEIKPLLPAIHHAVVHPAPSGEMFADGIRIAGLHVLADHKVREGMELCLDVMEIQRWGKQNRIKGCLDALAKYQGAAKPLLPRMKQLEKDLMAHSEAKNLQEIIAKLRSIIASVEASTDSPHLISLSS